jgi:DNA polymerase III epsilon subunit-like protein
MSVGGFTLGSVIDPGAATQAPCGCEGAASAQEERIQTVHPGEGLTRLKLVAPGELAGAGPDGAGPDGAGPDGAGPDGAGIDEWDIGGRGVNGSGLDGPWGGRRLERRLQGWGGPDLRGGAGLGRLGATELSQVEFVVVDLETTGWSPEVAAITEIAAVRVTGAGAVGWRSRRGDGPVRGDGGYPVRGDGGRRREFSRLGEFASLVNPGVPVPPGIAELTGITDWMLAAAPGLGAVLPRLLEFSRGCVLVAHNAPFDLRFLVAGCGDCGLAWPGFTVLDTVMLARRVMDPDEVADCKLSTLAGFFGARTAPSHRALADARATADVLSWLIRRLEHRGIRTVQQLSAWPDVVA